jgi:hypothetical protein
MKGFFCYFKTEYEFICDLCVEILAVATAALNIHVFWDFTPCRLVTTYQNFGGTLYLRRHCEAVVEAVHTSETSVTIYQLTRHNIP